MPSPVVPPGYTLSNTYESTGTFDETIAKVKSAIKDVYTVSPDNLMYVCRQLHNHNLYAFHVLLFHSDKCEFVEIKYFGKKRELFHQLELNFATSAGFTPSERNKKPCTMDYQFRPVPLPLDFIAEVPELPELNVDALSDTVRQALFYTEPNASYKELICGIGICVELLPRPEIFTNLQQPKLEGSGFVLIQRLVDLILCAPERELKCLAIDALSMLSRFKLIVRSIAIHALKDSDELVRVLAGRLLVSSALMNE